MTIIIIIIIILSVDGDGLAHLVELAGSKDKTRHRQTSKDRKWRQLLADVDQTAALRR